MEKAIVVTSINGVTEAIQSFIEQDGWTLIYVSDKNTEWDSTLPDDRDDIVHLTPWKQTDLEYPIAQVLGWNTFMRKNVGYTHAINNGFDEIADVDDDNIPLQNWSSWDNPYDRHYLINADNRWFNIYDYFYEDQDIASPEIWPRGYPLRELQGVSDALIRQQEYDPAAVVQGQMQGNPDVDAIHRLTRGQLYNFEQNKRPVTLDRGTLCPFNAQNTLWREQAFVYMYLPCTVSMRVSDILRSYVAQYGLWSLDEYVSFIEPTVLQDRNEHDLIEDLNDEVPLYTDVESWIKTLETVSLESEPRRDIRTMYRSLVENNLLDGEELTYLDAWLTTIDDT